MWSTNTELIFSFIEWVTILKSLYMSSTPPSRRSLTMETSEITKFGVSWWEESNDRFIFPRTRASLWMTNWPLFMGWRWGRKTYPWHGAGIDREPFLKSDMGTIVCLTKTESINNGTANIKMKNIYKQKNIPRIRVLIECKIPWIICKIKSI